MSINKNALQSRINNLSRETGVNQNILLKSFFFDAFLKRLSMSHYHNNFIFKGGFLLSTSLGINMRSTMDIDFLIRRIPLEKEEITRVANEICSVGVKDNITFDLQSVEGIRDDDVYGGYHITLLGQLENIKETVNIDIATGDPITPTPVEHRYKCLFDESTLVFKAYNYETILAEKLQAILFRGIANSRSKDFYDVYILWETKRGEIDMKVLKKAFDNTCEYRGTIYNQENVIQIVTSIRNDEPMKNRWDAYTKKNGFAKDIEFYQTVECILTLFNLLFSYSV